MTQADVQARHYATVERAIGFIRQQLRGQPTLEQVAEAVQLSPFHLQRVFSEWAGLSPKRFLQYLTKEQARAALQRTGTVLAVADDLGLSSSSRLHDLMVTCEAMTPGEIQAGGAGLSIGHGVGHSPFGEVYLAWTPRGICYLAFVDQPLPRHELVLREAWPHAALVRDDAQARRWLTHIFEPARGREPIPLLLRGTNFQLKVWEALIRIRPGEVLSYGQVAQRIGQPRAQRAVGSALARNDIGYLIPCHRVIQESGALGQYRWRPDRKLAMQVLEQGQGPLADA